MKNKDLMLQLHNSSRKYIISRIESHKHQQTFLLTWHKCHEILRSSENHSEFLNRIDVLAWEFHARDVKKWWPTYPTHELLAIDNCKDIVNSLEKRFV